ncbi:hypothetical protein OFN56_29430, partial [Escherichia coli]|nr:hypothetical protein [Escherichia coli]
TFGNDSRHYATCLRVPENFAQPDRQFITRRGCWLTCFATADTFHHFHQFGGGNAGNRSA